VTDPADVGFRETFNLVDAYVDSIDDDEIEARYAEFLALIDATRPAPPPRPSSRKGDL